MKLQKREVRLLALLIFVGVLALFAQYLILPELKKGDGAKEANSNLLLARSLLFNQDGRADALEASYQQQAKGLEKLLQKELSPYRSREELDRTFTALALAQGLRPLRLSMEDPAPEEPVYENLQRVYLTLTLEGKLADLLNLMGTMEQTSYLKLRHLNLEVQGETYVHTLGLEILMLKEQ